MSGDLSPLDQLLIENAAVEFAVKQIAELCAKVTRLKVAMSPDGSGFCSHSESTKSQGILHVNGIKSDDNVLTLQLEVARASSNQRISFGNIFHHLSRLGEKTRVLPPMNTKPGVHSIYVELRIHVSPLSFTRLTALTAELENLENLAKALQAELPGPETAPDLIKIYDGYFDLVEPIYPLDAGRISLTAEWMDWARQTMDFLAGSTCLALRAMFPITEEFAVALLAGAAIERGSSIAKFIPPLASPKMVVDFARKVPGAIILPAVRLSLGTNAYELANEIQTMLASLNSSRTPVVFSGSDEDLRSVFHGGQGGTTNPLLPVICQAPDAGVETLARFAIQSIQKRAGGIPMLIEERLVAELLAALKDYSTAEQKRILPIVANHAVNTWIKGNNTTSSTTASFAARLISVSESLTGMSVKPRSARKPAVQQQYLQSLTDPKLSEFLKERLLGQDMAIDHLISRLRMEVLTRPAHQPLRYCAQGTPATGKSESAVLLASRLGIPYVNIDAASIPDYYSAAAQLLGSGRGIVGSYQSGRLEQAAKQHTGVLIEVSDLDHANDRVRSGLSDLFLQVLETGEAQSATGTMFSCANLIFAFTMNLPDGADETLRKGFGFNDSVDGRQLQNRVIGEIKKILSTAFLSRVGAPILFEPLNEETVAVILERAVRSAIQAAAQNMNLPIDEIVLEKGLGQKLAASAPAKTAAFGARALLEQGRIMAAEAILALSQNSFQQTGSSYQQETTTNFYSERRNHASLSSKQNL